MSNDFSKPNELLEVEAYVNTHSHIREGDVVGPLLMNVIEGGADTILPMPNALNGLMTVTQVLAYIRNAKDSIAKYDGDIHFIPTMALNEETSDFEIVATPKNGIMDVKIYPFNRTTNSHFGVRHYSRVMKKVRLCGERNVKVHVHPEHPWMTISNRDAEYMFLPIVDMFLHETNATIVWEHGTDSRCIPFWKEMATSGRFFLTLTPHHLASNEDIAFGDVRSVCKPPIKTERDRGCLMDLVLEDLPWVMLGPDDAPHNEDAKHPGRGKCACGAYTAPFVLQLTAHAFGKHLHTPHGEQTFRNFTSRNARKVYKLPPASRTFRLTQTPFRIPRYFSAGSWKVEPFWAGEEIGYTLLPSKN